MFTYLLISMSTKTAFISKWSWLLVLLYLFLGNFTFFYILYNNFARHLFMSSEFLMQFNVVWFGLLIVFYGLYALIRNYKRISRLGINDTLDTQFLIVMMFFFLTVSLILNFIIYFNTSLTSDQVFALSSLSSVIMYGALVLGLFSIILPKLLLRKRKSVNN